METKKNTSVGLPTFNDPGRYGEQIITQGQFPDGGGGMSSGGTSVADNSFDFPTPPLTGEPKPLDPLDQVKADRKISRRGKRAVNKANRYNKRNPNNKINVPGQQPPSPPPPPSDDDGSGIGSGIPMMGSQSPQGTVPMQNLVPDQTAMSYQPPMPGNVQGNAQPVFNPSATNAAQQIYGSQEQRQQSVPGAPLYMHHDTGSSLSTFATEVAFTKAASTGASKAMFAQFGSSLGIGGGIKPASTGASNYKLAQFGSSLGSGGGVKPSGRLKRKEEKLKKTAKQLASNEIGMKDWSRKLTKYNKTKKQISSLKK